ncbi:hypothetical protein HPB50_011881 [Hyalomma asiaticum]|uniref:Uncharacterized protein n=1 Tax=Hyalomma asiaticum TaxID=266040 RepID=A0ACB7RZG7_HYAAI|nr:hypothetical protein HPB50_011881 [Hyalomma asiaticum]
MRRLAPALTDAGEFNEVTLYATFGSQTSSALCFFLWQCVMKYARGRISTASASQSSAREAYSRGRKGQVWLDFNGRICVNSALYKSHCVTPTSSNLYISGLGALLCAEDVQAKWSCRESSLQPRFNVRQPVERMAAGGRWRAQCSIPRCTVLSLAIASETAAWRDQSYVMKSRKKLSQALAQGTSKRTRAALLTGRYPYKLGIQRNAIRHLEPDGLPLGLTTLAEELKARNYSTHAFGKYVYDYQLPVFFATGGGLRRGDMKLLLKPQKKFSSWYEESEEYPEKVTFPWDAPKLLLFNITADPYERNDLSTTFKEEAERLKFELLEQVPLMIPSQDKEDDPKGDPSLQKPRGAYGPGWCKAPVWRKPETEATAPSCHGNMTDD